MEENKTDQTNQGQKKCSFWSYLSPKMTFIFGLCAGIAIFASLNLLYSFLALTKVGGERAAVAQTEDQTLLLEENWPETDGMEEPAGVPVGSFLDTGWSICQENGKPVVRLFSTTWCPHCTWIKDSFDKVMKEYIDQGKIAAYHWEFDTGNNTLSETLEETVPLEEEDVFYQFNPYGSIPTFVFGCRYYRIGNAYAGEGDVGLLKEEQEFRDLIEMLLAEK